VLYGKTTTTDARIDVGGGAPPLALDTATTPDLLFIGYSPGGEYQFARIYGTVDDDDVGSIAVSTNNHVIVSGLFSETLTVDGTPIPPGTGVGDSYVLRFDPRPVP
jgi:hypothetical protein